MGTATSILDFVGLSVRLSVWIMQTLVFRLFVSVCYYVLNTMLYTLLFGRRRGTHEKMFLGTAPPLHKQICWSPLPKKLFGQEWKRSKLFQMTWNAEKIGQKWFLFLYPPPQKKMGEEKIMFVKNEWNKVVPNYKKQR